MILLSPETFIQTYLAGFVKRHHTNPSPMQQNVGHHTWGAMMILDYIYPAARKEVLVAMMRHDVAERWVSDVPAYVKWGIPGIAAAIKDAEERTENLLHYDNELTETEWWGVKVADMLELYLFCSHCINAGDQYFIGVRRNVEEWFYKNDKMMREYPGATMLLLSIRSSGGDPKDLFTPDPRRTNGAQLRDPPGEGPSSRQSQPHQSPRQLRRVVVQARGHRRVHDART